VLAVGAYAWDGAAGSYQGAVYVFDWNGASWVERTTALTPSDAGASDYFGSGCALSADGTVLAVGAQSWDGAAGSDQGAVYVFDHPLPAPTLGTITAGAITINSISFNLPVTF